ncbi:MAG: sigma-54 dependent transcriptional regulator [Candidatus Brocadiaceae bacterium]|jgi:DNA-binding NtrC family response regulator
MPEQTAVLIMDDDPIVRESLSEYLRVEEYRVSAASSLSEAMSLLEDDHFRIALVDVRLPEGSGFELLQRVREQRLPTAVIMLTGYGTVEDAVRAIKMGAFDYVTKPVSDEEVKIAIERALQQQELMEENERLREQLKLDFRHDEIVYRDQKMEKVLERVRVVARTDATVLITGESGTGKTMAARAIHMNSSRAEAPFVEVNCGTLPETLLESELFGHVKGAFSGAIADKRGRFEAADEGTLLLDEISLASPSLQMKLLRVLEAFKFEPVGSTDTREVDVRLILATNEDLGRMVREGKFREDLYYRVNVMNIHIPPLRERVQDIFPLAQHFVAKHSGSAIHEVEGISEEAMRQLTAYDWPGNVRELENVIQRAVVLCDGPYVTPDDLDIEMPGPGGLAFPDGEITPLKRAMKKVERRLLLAALEACEGNRKAAAERLDINRTTLYNKLHEHGLMDA